MHDYENKSSLLGKNVTILGRRTSVRLEPEMWDTLYEVVKNESTTIHELCSLIALRKRDNSSLTASIRVFLLLYYRSAATNHGHTRAGHGCFKEMLKRAKIDVDLRSGQPVHEVNYSSMSA